MLTHFLDVQAVIYIPGLEAVRKSLGQKSPLQLWGCKGNMVNETIPRWWFHGFFFTPTWGKIPNLTNIFRMG